MIHLNLLQVFVFLSVPWESSTDNTIHSGYVEEVHFIINANSLCANMDLHETFYMTAGVAAWRICNRSAPPCPASLAFRYWESGGIFYYYADEPMFLSRSVRRWQTKCPQEAAGIRRPVPVTHTRPAICNSKQAALPGFKSARLPFAPATACPLQISNCRRS